MAGGRKKVNFERRRLELIAEAPFIVRIHAQAERLGLSLSSYIRLAVTERLERDEASVPPPPPAPKRKS
jgi:hypothetical protein